jgi:16S rRNA (adenine1518-N6/adenine1519-N6)-dimethyltransferase
MILMVQHEVATRIVARGGKESILSISVKAYGEPKMIMKVPARYFSPAPKVDSAVIAITNISRKNFDSPLEEYPLGGGGNIIHPVASATPQEGNNSPHPNPLLVKERGIDEEKFWEIVKAGFAHKRKKLSSNLKILQKNGGIASVENLGNKRAEDLSLQDWILLAK